MNKPSGQVTVPTSTHHKHAPTSNTTEKERDDIIPAKDKNPDDLEISE